MGNVKHTKEDHVTGYKSQLTWRILHRYHEGLVLQEVLIVLDDVWVVEQFQHLTLILSRQSFIPRHLLHWDLLQDDKSAVAAPAAQVNNPDRPGEERQMRCMFS